MSAFRFYGSGLPAVGVEDLHGKLIVVEGTDGVGRSTQVTLLRQWLEQRGHAVIDTGLTRSALAGKGLKRAKEGNTLNLITHTLFYATDFADRLERDIIPALRSGGVVLSDRYIFTAFARDVVRGVDPRWVRKVYNFAVKPTLAFYFRVPLDVALGRILGGRNALKYYEAGMDLNLADDLEGSFRMFQERILKQYELLVKEYGLVVIVATKSIEEQQAQMRAIVKEKLLGLKRLPNHRHVGVPVLR